MKSRKIAKVKVTFEFLANILACQRGQGLGQYIYSDAPHDLEVVGIKSDFVWPIPAIGFDVYV